ncbi:dimethylarginine dimethylaminohydrolase family protein [Gilliamella sp. B2776]|uniref:dimethylargininase n=1 Tax=unclassified Gilliamella TaxID=2685620 RepID=UPI002269B72D|nr:MULTISPECIES: dimethylargininase [unclassified Gilliamella]MCX8649549.1 dimethylarginine dimethylaminohydrolase family protein [Gilliamella sp. B2779]MCX8654593.1 dimethylarginine dimethylaminohydrolase family protein [Gilliamella sp. B2737]MCX8664983.1 dimethylarginine dimethylaminohydrolase family protein [Gilliamella sp. B2887]MCX8692268.1 dimethylarginine dimethylaminohydrolase family protein [Gilliamella sp. B2776]MCX8697579.1 dimethylarginine dimethylaminohydrolase family protein [Gil
MKKFNHIIARTPAKSLIDGLTSANLGKPNYQKALDQHNDYIRALQQCDVDITILPANERFPDSVFVEDTVLCTPNCAIITRPGAVSRRGETEIIQATIERFYPNKVESISAPGTVEAGDIMMVGDHYYIGLSARTNQSGADQMIAILEKHGLSGSVVTLEKVLHLKTGLAYLEHDNLLATGEFITKPEFQHLNIIEIPDKESYAANCIWVNERVIMPYGYPMTKAKIEALGYQVIEVDTSEYRKIDGGVSCMSLRF